MEQSPLQFNHSCPALSEVADADHEPAAPVGSADPDDTGIDAAVPRGPTGGRPRGEDRVRIGCFAVPTGPFSFTVAIAIHAAVIGGALLWARWYLRRPRLPGDWGGGGGTGEVSLVDSDAPAGPAKSGVPGDAALPPVRPARLAPPPREQDRVASPFNPARATQLEPDAGGKAGDADPLIGVAVAADPGSTPVFNHPRLGDVAGIADSSASAAPKARTSGSAPSISAPEGRGGMTRNAGLPGALHGHGLPAPDYPPEARRRGEQGVVKVAIEVLPDGSLGDIRVVSDPGYSLLRDAALAATQKLRRFPFTPACRFGKPVRDVVIIPYHFILQ